MFSEGNMKKILFFLLVCTILLVPSQVKAEPQHPAAYLPIVMGGTLPVPDVGIICDNGFCW